jgi:predicted Na+-dependent transporter
MSSQPELASNSVPTTQDININVDELKDSSRSTQEWVAAILSNLFLFTLIWGLSGTGTNHVGMLRAVVVAIALLLLGWGGMKDDTFGWRRSTATFVLSFFLCSFLPSFLSPHLYGVTTVNCKYIRKQLTNKSAILTGIGMQFLVLPALGCFAVVLFDHVGDLTEAMGIALLVVTTSPGGSYSNWWCSTFNADLSLSVAATTVSSVLSVVFLPVNLFLYTYLAFGRKTNEQSQSIIQQLDFKAIFITLSIVLTAIFLGMFCGTKYDTHKFHVFCNRIGSLSGLMLILFSIFMSSGADGSESTAWNQPWSFYAATAFPPILGMAITNVVARSLKLSKPETVAISIECCCRNTGIATSVAITMFSDAEQRAQAVAVPLFYGVVEATLILVYCLVCWKMNVRFFVYFSS